LLRESKLVCKPKQLATHTSDFAVVASGRRETWIKCDPVQVVHLGDDIEEQRMGLCEIDFLHWSTIR
jgi:hypothetical protein